MDVGAVVPEAMDGDTTMDKMDAEAAMDGDTTMDTMDAEADTVDTTMYPFHMWDGPDGPIHSDGRSKRPKHSKQFTNQNACFLCRFDIEDGHTSATCINQKPGHQVGFTWANYKQYKNAGHQYSRKAMLKTIYPRI